MLHLNVLLILCPPENEIKVKKHPYSNWYYEVPYKSIFQVHFLIQKLMLSILIIFNELQMTLITEFIIKYVSKKIIFCLIFCIIFWFERMTSLSCYFPCFLTDFSCFITLDYDDYQNAGWDVSIFWGIELLKIRIIWLIEKLQISEWEST